jgi:hypothetical protein
MMYSANTSGNGQDITARTNAMVALMLPSLPPDGTPTGCDGTYIIARWNACETDIDVSIITTVWYTRPALMYPSSPPDGTLV